MTVAHISPRAQDRRHSRKRVARLMRQAGLQGQAAKRWKKTTVPALAAYAALADERRVALSVGRTSQFFCSLKGELIDTSAWPTRVGARREVVEYSAWYNGTRLYSSLGYQSPADYESSHREKSER